MRGAGRKKVWLLGVGGGLGLLTAFVALLVVGTYLAAASGWRGRPRGRAGQGRRSGGVSGARAEVGQSCAPRINPALLAAQLYQESGWNPNAQSGAQAQGIAQFIPGTWATHGVDGDGDGDRDVWDPKDAIPSAASYDCKLASYVKDAPGESDGEHARRLQRGRVRGDQVRRGSAVQRDAELRRRRSAPWRRASPPASGRVDPSKQARRRHLLRAEEAGHALSVGRERHAGAGRPLRLLGADAGRVPERRHHAAARRQRPVQRRSASRPRRTPPGRPGVLRFDDLTNSRAIRPRRASTSAAAT